MIRVFSYGSNLCTQRLLDRIPGAVSVGVGCIEGFKLEFHKRAKDGSGKANAFLTQQEGDFVWGVVHEMSPRDKRRLDRMESLGVGYFERQVTVEGDRGLRTGASVYVANPDWIDMSLVPYSWYLDFVLIGAMQHDFAAAYVDRIRRVPYRSDPDRHRHERHRAIVSGVEVSGVEVAGVELAGCDPGSGSLEKQ